MAGGAIQEGRACGEWPDLRQGQFQAGRDLMALRDIGAYAAGARHRPFGTERGMLERAIFTGLDLGSDLRVLA